MMLKTWVAVRGQRTMQTPTIRLRFKSAPLKFVTIVTSLPLDVGKDNSTDPVSRLVH